VFVDPSGNIYATDTSYGRVRFMHRSSGLVYTVIGGGSTSADGIAGTGTKLMRPADVFVDSAANVYVADSNDYSIRKLSESSGLVSTVAGTGSQSFGGDGGPATSSRMWYPTSMWVSNHTTNSMQDLFCYLLILCHALIS
jgi:hypothetical protein